MERKIMNSPEFRYDAVIILSQSDWFSEMRSNRYNYAKRFSQTAPVFFLQAYNKNQKNLIAGQDGNITVINPIHGYTHDTLSEVFALLKPQEIRKILVWTYNPYYIDSLKQITIPFETVFHATEAFLGSNFIGSPENKYVQEYVNKIRETINFCSFVVAVSEGVAEGIKNDPYIVSPVYAITNGCDFSFWNGFDVKERERAVLYQGGIHRKIDFSLLLYLIEHNPAVQFWFCGQETIEGKTDRDKWKLILKKGNAKFFGQLHPDKVRELSHRAKVGIIPFKNEDWLTDKSFPLKAFEYLASGMEAVSTPVKALEKYTEHFSLCDDYELFDQNLKIALDKNEPYTLNRIELCKLQDYDIKFLHALELIRQGKVIVNLAASYRKRVLFLYDVYSCHVNTIREHVNAFGLYSKNDITYYNASRKEKIHQYFIDSFDVLVVHYSIRVSVPGYFSEDIHSKLKKFSGVKILLIQDEYDNLSSTYHYMEEAGYDIVFTCVPDEFHNYVYPASRFPAIKLINNFTGYTSYTLNNFHTVPLKDRTTDVFYRGRKLPFFYGTLGVEKYEIGIKFKQKCEELGINLTLDLESNDSERIYGDAWYKIISRSKVMLGTESGSNVFDFNGDLHKLIQQEVKKGSDYSQIFKKYLEPLETQVKMNQISPKLFEAIALKTVLVLYEGGYSGILIPYRHYIPLKKDFSNFNEVVKFIGDNKALQKIADTAFDEIVGNQQLSYKHYIQGIFDKAVDEKVLFVKKLDLMVKSDFYKLKINHTGLSFQFFKKVKKAFISPTNMSETYDANRIFFKRLHSIKYRSMNLFKIYIIRVMSITPPFLLKILQRGLKFFK